MSVLNPDGTTRQLGDVFEVDGTWYVIVDQGRKLPARPEKVHPQPVDLPEEYIHIDGATHVCANLRCPNLVPRSLNPGIDRLYCSRRCGLAVTQRRHDAKRQGGKALLRDPLHRLYAVIVRRSQSVARAQEKLFEHLDGLIERCPEATEASNFHCPGRFNTHCYTQEKWQRWHIAGAWPGVCLIYATLRDHYKSLYYAERALPIQRDFTVGRGEYWRWKDENDMLPLPEGIARR